MTRHARPLKFRGRLNRRGRKRAQMLLEVYVGRERRRLGMGPIVLRKSPSTLLLLQDADQGRVLIGGKIPAGLLPPISWRPSCSTP